MTKLEIQGWIQIVLGVLGIGLTVLNAPDLMKAIGVAIETRGVPANMAGFAETVSMFAVIFVLVVLVFIVLAGAALSLSAACKAMGAVMPMACAAAIVLSLFSFAVCLTMALIGTLFWLPAFVAAVCLLLISVGFAVDESGSAAGIVFLIGGGLFLVTGVIALISLSDPQRSETAVGAQIPPQSAVPAK